MKNFGVLQISPAVKLVDLLELAEKNGKRFFLLRDMNSNELGSIEIRLVADHDLQLAYEDNGRPN